MSQRHPNERKTQTQQPRGGSQRHPKEVQTTPLRLNPKTVTKETTRVAETFNAPSYVPGIKHIVEGFDGVTMLNRDRVKAISPTKGRDGSQYVGADFAFNRKQNEKYQAAVKAFRDKQALRLKIPSLPDTESLNVGQEKEAAKRRLRGRLGTMLSGLGLGSGKEVLG